MPLYEYECTACHRHTEKIQKFSDPEITVCPFCAGALKRVLSAPAISFKGGGWYADGYGNAKPKSSGEGSSSDAKTEAKPGDTKSAEGPSKPAASTESSSPAPSTPPPAAAPASTSKTD